jgi:hypothetical protein
MNKNDLARLNALHNMPCICCEIEDEMRGRHIEQPNRTTAHHLVDMGTRELSGGHQATLPMCEWHHLGYRHPDYDNCDMAAKWGPSMKHEKKKWIARYGGERPLLALVNKRLEHAA